MLIAPDGNARGLRAGADQRFWHGRADGPDGDRAGRSAQSDASGRSAAPADRLLRPILWTEDDSAVLFADPQAQTTWKATVRDGTFEQVANGIYLGTLYRVERYNRDELPFCELETVSRITRLSVMIDE